MKNITPCYDLPHALADLPPEEVVP